MDPFQQKIGSQNAENHLTSLDFNYVKPYLVQVGKMKFWMNEISSGITNWFLVVKHFELICGKTKYWLKIIDEF